MRILQIGDTEHFGDLPLNYLNKLWSLLNGRENLCLYILSIFTIQILFIFTFSTTFNPLSMVYSSSRQEHQVFRSDPFLSTLFFRKMNLFLRPLLPLVSFPTVNQLNFLEVIISG